METATGTDAVTGQTQQQGLGRIPVQRYSYGDEYDAKGIFSTASSIGRGLGAASPPPTSPTTLTQPKNWLARSPRNAAFSLPPLGLASSTSSTAGAGPSHPPSAFVASSSSLANAYATGWSERKTPTQKHISWGELPKPPSVKGGSRPGSRQGQLRNLVRVHHTFDHHEVQ
ncbi:hypothetical protein BT96DRAFT_698007 [Gymnopus androsaceus JB14]|uniref:Uncharacterized protein n=1 Tax=Gymnopus androsaceus JB14 TaxID=1447944 RepID=A0A6A4IIP2_9AGAR|nr:hypothetical protein BT96DRAFT_698007 [Gymnopus androsaceus JB14]